MGIVFRAFVCIVEIQQTVHRNKLRTAQNRKA